MSDKPIFSLDPDQLERLLSIGTGQQEPSEEQAQPVGAGADAASGRQHAPSEEIPSVHATASLLDRELPGSRIGRYKLLRVLGEGGMGVVYLAEQEGQIRRRVALKIIKPGMDSKRVIARFENERQALALLDHPGIAQVHDAGTSESGRPYFVMEYVKGSPVTDYSDRHRLSIEQRLRLFQDVCHAVHHAHQKGIIHRDLKPSNILVSTEGDRAVAKIIDFGVAKAMAAPLTERTLFTEDSHLLGTPEYMSPEQAEMANEDIDTRSDIYSLGVLLYVLLAGILPYDSKTFRAGGVENIRKMIRETDPKTPSTRLTKLGEEATKLAASRRTEVATLARRLHRELEWIPLKAMRKDRAERYRSASELADDIENYLNGAPLIAGPPGTAYKVKKFVRRNRALVGGVAALLAVLAAGVVVSSIFAIGQAHALADNRLITDFLENDVLAAASEARVDEATVTFILDTASEKLAQGKFKDKPLIEASLCRTLGSTYWRLSEYSKAEEHLLHTIQIFRQYQGDEHVNTLGARDILGYVYAHQGRYHDMKQLSAANLQIYQRRKDVDGQANSINMLAAVLAALGEYEEAESWFDAGLKLERTWRAQGAEGFGMFRYLRVNRACMYTVLGRYEDAEALFTETVARPDWPEDLYQWQLAYLYQEQGRFDQAEQLFVKGLRILRQKVGDKNYRTVEHMYAHARFLVDQDRYDEAETLLGKALPIARRRMRSQHPVTLGLVNVYGVLHTKRGDYHKAETSFDEALQGWQRELGDDHPHTLQTINDFGVLRREQGQHTKAEELLTKALEGRQAKLGPDHPHTLATAHELGLLHVAREDYDKAERFLLEAYNGRQAKLRPGHPRTTESLKQLVSLYESWNKPDEAAKCRANLPRVEDFEEQN